MDRYLQTRTDAFNILANYKEDERNYMRVVQPNDGIAFTTCDDANNHHSTHKNDVTHINDPSTTSNLTTSTNPQQHGSTLVTTGGGCSCNHNVHGSGGHGRSEGHTITCFCGGRLGTMHLHVHTPLRRPNDDWQWPNLLEPMMTVRQSSKY